MEYGTGDFGRSRDKTPVKTILGARQDLATKAYEGSLAMFMRKGWSSALESSAFISNWHIDCISDHLTAVSNHQIKGPLIFTMPPRHMKDCADSTPISTPSGYRLHGDIRAGDYVFGPDGLPTLVRGRSSAKIADIEVEFSNGEVIKVNGDHLWTVWDRSNGACWRTMTTTEIMTSKPGKGRNRFFIPDFECLQFNKSKEELPLHPYFIGCWLGDGCSTANNIAHDLSDCEHIAKLERLGYRVTAVWDNGGNGVRSSFGDQYICAKLRILGIFGNKSIPDVYATASIEDRMELLAGLIDTDGHVEKTTSRVRISTCDKEFASQIERLALSLGFCAYTLVAKTPGYGSYNSGHEFVYQVGFQPDRAIPTALPRKAIRRTEFAKRRRAIVDIRKAKIAEIGHCLNVEREDGLYLVGRTNIVTHNSVGINVFYPAWTWAQPIDERERAKGISIQPGTWKGAGVRFVYISYDQGLSNAHSTKCQALIQSPWYQQRWGDRFKLKQSRIEMFDNNLGGKREAFSFSGKLTGFGAHIIAIDDAHNVLSDSYEADRVKVLNAWDIALQSRLDDKINGIFIVAMQRSHENDLVGHILAKEFGGLHVCLPAEHERKHPFVFINPPQKIIRQTDSSHGKDSGPRIGQPWEDLRSEKEMLWAERFPRHVMEPDMKKMPTHAAAGQYQQRPTAREGGLFKRTWFDNPVKIIPPNLELVRAWDLASTAEMKYDPDYSVGVLMGRDKITGVLYVLSVSRGRWSPAEVEREVYSTAVMDGTTTRIRIPQDPGSAGKFQAFHLAGLLQGYTVSTERETGSKEWRAEPFAAQCEHGMVKLLEAAWNEKFIDELCSFPNGAHDDQVDAASAAFRALLRVVKFSAVGA